MREVKLFTPKKIIKKNMFLMYLLHLTMFFGPYNVETGTVDYIDKCFEKRTGIELRSVCLHYNYSIIARLVCARACFKSCCL
jgi:hypothetical protein